MVSFDFSVLGGREAELGNFLFRKAKDASKLLSAFRMLITCHELCKDGREPFDCFP